MAHRATPTSPGTQLVLVRGTAQYLCCRLQIPSKTVRRKFSPESVPQTQLLMTKMSLKTAFVGKTFMYDGVSCDEYWFVTTDSSQGRIDHGEHSKPSRCLSYRQSPLDQIEVLRRKKQERSAGRDRPDSGDSMSLAIQSHCE